MKETAFHIGDLQYWKKKTCLGVSLYHWYYNVGKCFLKFNFMCLQNLVNTCSHNISTENKIKNTGEMAQWLNHLHTSIRTIVKIPRTHM